MQTNRMRNVIELFAAHFIQALAAGVQLFVDLDGLLSHLLVSVLRTARQQKIVPRGHALVTIGVETNAQQDSFGGALGFTVHHIRRLKQRKSRSSIRLENTHPRGLKLMCINDNPEGLNTTSTVPDSIHAYPVRFLPIFRRAFVTEHSQIQGNMSDFPAPLDLSKVKVFPLAQRKSLSALEQILINPASPAPPCPARMQPKLNECAVSIRKARERGASVMLIYGAHLVKNGLQEVVNALVNGGWVTHLATNGAGTIHDWELSFFGRTEESVRANVATGTFGTWDETGHYLNLAVLAGALNELGHGRALGRFIEEDGCTLPTATQLEHSLRAEPGHPLSPARSDLLQAMLRHQLPSGRIQVGHPNKAHSILANAVRRNVPLTVHPGIGYDITATHPMFSGAAIGRAAQVDFAQFSQGVDGLDGGVVVIVGSAIMAPQVFEKSLSCVNNLRVQSGRPTVQGHKFFVVDIQDGGNWDWSQGEPPKGNPAYYLRFCKSFDRMGGSMNYLQMDNVMFVASLAKALATP